MAEHPVGRKKVAKARLDALGHEVALVAVGRVVRRRVGRR